MKVIDVRGKKAPLPLTLTLAACTEKHQQLRIITDNAESGQELAQCLKKEGYLMTLTAEENNIIVDAIRSDAVTRTQKGTPTSTLNAPKTLCPQQGRYCLLLSHVTLGDIRPIGEELMCQFLKNALQKGNKSRPDTVILLNEAVCLASQDALTFDDLRQFSSAGGTVLAEKLSLEQYQLTSQLETGRPADMKEIVEVVMSSKVTSL